MRYSSDQEAQMWADIEDTQERERENQERDPTIAETARGTAMVAAPSNGQSGGVILNRL
jgi:hypothetical protein